jgi:hypothetical protein
MHNESPVPDVEKNFNPVSATNRRTRQGAHAKELNTTNSASDHVENKTSSPSITQDVAQVDVVDWEGDDDPTKPMNW